jgi:hypothetical protein
MDDGIYRNTVLDTAQKIISIARYILASNEQWFDIFEGAKVSSKLLSKRWTAEITLRDKMFLEKMELSCLIDLSTCYPTFRL